MPAIERITLQNRSESVDKAVTDIVVIGGIRIDAGQFSPSGEETTTAGLTFDIRYTPKVAAELANINGFAFAGEEYKIIDSFNDRKKLRIVGERVV